MTYRQAISNCRSNLKLLSGDDTINDRVLLQEIKSVANMIVLQSLEQRKYWQSPNLFNFLPCIEMEQVPLQECCEYTGERMVSITKLSLPKIGEASFGNAVFGVFGMDGQKRLKETNANRYANILKLGLTGQGDYFWLRGDGHIIVTNPDAKLINLYAYFTELLPNSLLYPGEGCACRQAPDVESLCANPLDQRFPFIDKMQNSLNDQVYKNLLATYFNVPSNVNKTSNNMDESSK
jgi:hypothetical protein